MNPAEPIKLKQNSPIPDTVLCHLDSYSTKLETIIFSFFSWYAIWSIQPLFVVLFGLPFYALKYAILFAALASLVLVWTCRVERKPNPAPNQKFELETYVPTTFTWVIAAGIILVGSIF